MKKLAAAWLLALAVATTAYGAGARDARISSESNRASAAQAGSQGNAPASTKIIKDPAEYNAYITALNTGDPAARAAAMEAFVKQYPASVVKIDALEQAMAAYQKAGNVAKVQELAGQILEMDPANVRALAIAAFLERVKATSGDLAALKPAGDHCAKGLEALPNWRKSEGLSDDDFRKMSAQMTQIFNGTCGFVALNRRDYPRARDFYLKALATDSNNMQDSYQLAVAELQMDPLDPAGFWYAAKAINLAQGNAAATKAIAEYAKAKYRKYHGGEDGWEQIVAAAATQSAPPSGFAGSIKPAPTPADLAVEAVKQNDPATLSFSDWEYILSYRDASPANKEAADKVWAAIQDKQKQGAAKLRLPGVKVISATTDTIDAAVTDDHQQANTADLRVTMEKPMPQPPAPGAMIDILGVLTGYTPSPFMFRMEKGELAAPAARP
jgi:hypothetical protein